MHTQNIYLNKWVNLKKKMGKGIDGTTRDT